MLLALLGFSALVTEVAVLVERDLFDPGNFFSFFTVEGNAFAVGVLLVSAVAPKSRTLEMFRGAVTRVGPRAALIGDVAHTARGRWR